MTRHSPHVSELAAAHAVNSLPTIIGVTSTPALAAADPLTSLKAGMLDLAGQLNGRNWSGSRLVCCDL